MNDIRLAVFGAAISFVVVVGLAKGENTYHSDDHGYSISIPAGWERIPEEIMQQQYEKRLSVKARQTIIHDVEFQLESQSKWFQGESILVQVCYYSRLGLSTAPRPDQFEPLIRSITGIDIDKAKSKGVWSDEAKDSFGAPKISHVSVNKARRSYGFTSEVTMADSSKLTSLIHGFFGREAMVQISYNMSSEPTELRFLSDWAGCTDSFSFDASKKYRVAPKRPSSSNKMLVDLAVYGIVAVGIGIVSLIVGVVSKSKASKPD